MISDGAINARIITNNVCERSRATNPKNEGIARINTTQRTNIIEQIAAIKGLKGLHSRINIARPVNVIVTVNIVVMLSERRDPSTSKQKT